MKIVSGGQTGVDRAALDFALEQGIPCGGWCPQGRRAVGVGLADKYPLKETEARNYNKRTRLNVQDSGGTLVLNWGELNGGTAKTVRFAESMNKPYFVVNLDQEPDTDDVAVWINQKSIEVLNVAGPREEKCPGIYFETIKYLKKLLSGS